MDAEHLERAISLAVSAHSGQRDKAGAPYILHVLDVWRTVRDAGGSEAEQIVALLHDTVEDTDVSLKTIKWSFWDEIADAVDAITKRKGETRVEYLERVKANPIARVVKVADSGDNYRRLQNITDEAERTRLKAKYDEVFAALV